MNHSAYEFLSGLFATSPLNRLPEEFGGSPIFSQPLIGVSSGDDPLFARWPEVIGPKVLKPLEMWEANGKTAPGGAGSLRILSIIFPYTDFIRQKAMQEREYPSLFYSAGRNWADSFQAEAADAARDWFESQGYQAIAPALTKPFMLVSWPEKKTIYSTWSERHMAFAAGLGSFSLHEGFISEAGCNIRLASVMTDAPLSVTPRPDDEPYRNCLYMNGLKCMKCAQRCPGENALTEKGHDKLNCLACLQKMEAVNREKLAHLTKPHYKRIDGQDTWSHPTGCAFCQFGVPCMDKNPMAKKQA